MQCILSIKPNTVPLTAPYDKTPAVTAQSVKWPATGSTLNSGRDRRLLFLQNFQTSSKAQTSSYSEATVGKAAEIQPWPLSWS